MPPVPGSGVPCPGSGCSVTQRTASELRRAHWLARRRLAEAASLGDRARSPEVALPRASSGQADLAVRLPWPRSALPHLELGTCSETDSWRRARRPVGRVLRPRCADSSRAVEKGAMVVFSLAEESSMCAGDGQLGDGALFLRSMMMSVDGSVSCVSWPRQPVMRADPTGHHAGQWLCGCHGWPVLRRAATGRAARAAASRASWPAA
jgi:hypothetical protein